MEMRITGKRLGGAVTQTAVKEESPARKSVSGGKPQRDRLEISRQAVDYLAEQAKRLTEEIARAGQPEEDTQKSGESSMLDFLKEEMDVMDKCSRISASISSGDRVPPEDLRYLMEHDIHSYLLALATRKPKEDPEDKDSVLTEEDLAEEEAGGAQASTADAPEASSAEGT